MSATSISEHRPSKPRAPVRVRAGASVSPLESVRNASNGLAPLHQISTTPDGAQDQQAFSGYARSASSTKNPDSRVRPDRYNYAANRLRREPKVRSAIEARLVRVPGGCVEWPTSSAYGTVSVFGFNFQAHRLFYALKFGDPGCFRVIDHKCRNGRCVNTEHLQEVTQSENVRLGYQRARDRGEAIQPRNPKGFNKNLRGFREVSP